MVCDNSETFERKRLEERLTEAMTLLNRKKTFEAYMILKNPQIVKSLTKQQIKDIYARMEVHCRTSQETFSRDFLAYATEGRDDIEDSLVFAGEADELADKYKNNLNDYSSN